MLMLCWFQNEKNQILKSNIWLRLVSVFDTFLHSHVEVIFFVNKQVLMY